MASLQHLGGDRWRVRVHTTQGRTVSRSFTASGERAARRKVASIEADLRDEAAHTAAERLERRGSVAELVDDWLAVKRRKCSPSTMPAYERHGRAITARFGTMRAADLTGADIDRWYAELHAAGTTDAGLAVLHRHLRMVLRHGHFRRGLPSVATSHAEATTHKAPKPRPPKPAAVQAVVSGLPVTERPWARAVALLAATGMRRGEVVGLRWADVDGSYLWVQRAVIEVRGEGAVVRPFPKGKEPRFVPLEAIGVVLLDAQRRWLESTGVESPWVFPDLTRDASGRLPRRPGWVSLLWGRHRDEYGATGWGLHQLRHAYAVTLLDAGVPINTVQSWLGHAKASTTIDIYGNRGDAGEALGREVLRLALSPAESPAP